MTAAALRIDAATREAQARASDPARSAWVSANAGTGKTYVLVARVVRLLLAGVDPARILCLTFTKAAAANMATRVFALLGGWATLDDAALDAAIAELAGEPPSPAVRSRARRLFARAIETPGGLKIQTIHAFCERVLQMFPFEANVAGGFTVLDEAGAGALLEAALAEAVRDAAADGPLGDALAAVADEADGEAFRNLLAEALKRRADFHAAGDAGAIRDALAAAHGVPAGLEADRILADHFAAETPARLRALADWLAGGKTMDQGNAECLRRSLSDGPPEARFEALGDLFLTDKGEPRSAARLATKALCQARPDLAATLLAERDRFLASLDLLKTARLIARSAALAVLVRAVLARYARAKADRGALDFDDLIAKTVVLLSRHGAAWVHYKLDRGVTHVLVDEAQDTSLGQWEILRKLTAEFTAGAGAEGPPRTVFAVGDEKQSIYGFQGAAPRAFAENHRHFEQHFKAAGLALAPVRLTLSFRSTVEVLAAVDRVFAAPERHRSIVFDDPAGRPVHESHAPARPGFVEIWPLLRSDKPPEADDAWAQPVDAPDPDSPRERLARRLARYVGALVRHGDPTGRPVRPGDVTMLVRRRDRFFEALIRALKQQGLAVAGADRVTLADHIAVKDLLALGRASLLPHDDFTLACLLKSPLIGLTDQDLMRFAPERRGSLAAALRVAAESDLWLAAAAAKIARWRALAGHAGPFAFYAAALEADGGRRAFLSRLGPEAADVVDMFLARALDHEASERPTLACFLERFVAGAGEIKRDLDQTADEIRVMTVHAAKGLEAPVVILPDTVGRIEARHDPRLYDIGAPGRPLIAWSPRRDDDTAPVAAARAAQRREREDEDRRLLYVALTRARNGLVICGHAGRNAPPEGCWHRLVETGLEAGEDPPGALAPAAAFDGDGEVRRFVVARPLEAVGPIAAGAGAGADEPEPAWLRVPPAPEAAPAPPPIAPSRAGDAADRPERPLDPAGRSSARARGILVHRLLEALPACAAERRPALAAALARRHGAELGAAERERLVAETLALLEAPELGELFGPGGLVEVPVAGRVRLPDGRERPVAGRIDRILVTPGRVVIADFKTAAEPPAGPRDIPPSALAQLALYRALAENLFAPRPVAALIVYTAGPTVVPVPAPALDAALASLTRS